MKILFNTRYMGVLLIVLSVVLFVIMFNFSQAMLGIIDSGQIGSCEEYSMCPHVTVLNQTYLGYLVALIILMVGIVMVIFGGVPEEAVKAKTDWDKTLRNLSGDEKEVYEKIMASEGMIFQGSLVEQTGFPKAKVSRILDKMEGRGLLERRRRGMSNAIVLK